jgi:hypothetical protein
MPVNTPLGGSLSVGRLGGEPREAAMSTNEQPHRPTGGWYPPEEALQHAQLLPPPADMLIEDLTDEEWDAFVAAINDT